MPHVERRYLIVPGIGSSRIHILDTKPNPQAAEDREGDRARGVHRKTGYTAPHTIHCGPDGIYGSALGAATATVRAASS